LPLLYPARLLKLQQFMVEIKILGMVAAIMVAMAAETVLVTVEEMGEVASAIHPHTPGRLRVGPSTLLPSPELGQFLTRKF
jgi:hypothetical protein